MATSSADEVAMEQMTSGRLLALELVDSDARPPVRCKTLRRTLPVQQFIALFLQHVLPRGFTKIRYYGLLSPSSKHDLERARTLLDSAAQPSRRSTSAVPAATNFDTRQDDSTAAADPPKTPRYCPACGKGHLLLKETFPRSRAPP